MSSAPRRVRDADYVKEISHIYYDSGQRGRFPVGAMVRRIGKKRIAIFHEKLVE